MLTLMNRTLLANRNGLTLGTRSLAQTAELNMVRPALRTLESFQYQDMQDAWPGMDPICAAAHPRAIAAPSIPGSIGEPIGWVHPPVVPVPRWVVVQSVSRPVASDVAKRTAKPAKRFKSFHGFGLGHVLPGGSLTAG